MATFTWARGIICAAHRDRRDGALHGHTWEVWARFPGYPEQDARDLQAALAGVLGRWDHDLVEDPSGEALAAIIGEALADLGCDAVRLERRLEGIVAEWQL